MKEVVDDDFLAVLRKAKAEEDGADADAEEAGAGLFDDDEDNDNLLLEKAADAAEPYDPAKGYDRAPAESRIQ